MRVALLIVATVWLRLRCGQAIAMRRADGEQAIELIVT
jgi:hypothetical protein